MSGSSDALVEIGAIARALGLKMPRASRPEVGLEPRFGFQAAGNTRPGRIAIFLTFGVGQKNK